MRLCLLCNSGVQNTSITAWRRCARICYGTAGGPHTLYKTAPCLSCSIASVAVYVCVCCNFVLC